MTTNVAASPKNKLRRLPRVASDLAKLENLAELLETASNDDIVAARETLAGIEATSWRGQCMCDAELLSRAIKQQGGRGKADDERLGVMAAAREISRTYGISNRTVLQNAQLYNTFFAVPDKTSESAFTSLRSKWFFILALPTADPKATIKSFAEAKQKASDFNTTDARRMLRQKGEPASRQMIESIESFKDDVRRTWFNDTILTIEKLAETCPVPNITPELHRMRSWFIIQRDRSPAKDEVTIRSLYPETLDTWAVEDLADETAIPHDEVREICERLVAGGYLEIAPRAKTEAARGARSMVYRRVK